MDISPATLQPQFQTTATATSTSAAVQFHRQNDHKLQDTKELPGNSPERTKATKTSSLTSESAAEATAVVAEGGRDVAVQFHRQEFSGNSPERTKTTKTSSSTSESAAAATAAVVKRGHDVNDDDDEEDVCRICRNPGNDKNPLRYPCACNGTIKFVHQGCLQQWLSHSRTRHCEVCKHPFSFSPVYVENAPTRLPFWNFVFGIGKKAFCVLKSFLRLSFVLSLSLLVIPFITLWIWRLAFVRSFSEANHLFLSRMSFTVILTDCLRGFPLSASIAFIFLVVTSLRVYFRHAREAQGLEVDREDGGERNGARAVRRPLGQANRNLLADGNGDDAGDAPGIAGAGQLIRRAENVAAQQERQAARLEARVDKIFDGLDDVNGPEDVPFDEPVGMQRPIFHFVKVTFTVLASNMIFLGVVIFAPFSVGRVILHYISWLYITLKNTLTAVTNPSENPENLIGNVSEILKKSAGELNVSPNISTPLASDVLKGMTAGTSKLSDVTTLAVGYMFIFSIIFLYFGLVALIRYTKGEPRTRGRFQGISSATENIPSLLWQFFAGMRHLMTMVKVAFLLVVELGVLPLMCGWWLDICTIKMFGKSMAHRVEFFSISPLASSLVHWVVGILYLNQIKIFVSLLREVLRNGVLYFLPDPADPNYNPIRDLIADPVHKHARDVLLNVAVYGSLIVMLTFLPVKLAMRMAPSIFPLDISLSDPITEIPVGVQLFEICIPFAVEHFKLRTTIKSLLHHWITAVSWALGLTEFLLPKLEDTAGQYNGNAEAGRQDRLRGLQGGAHQNHAQLAFLPDVQNNKAHMEEYDEDQSDEKRYRFVFRIVLLLVVAWTTLLIFNSVLIVIPVSLGRFIFNSLPLLPITHGIKCNDLYAFTIGSYLIWTAIAGVRYTFEKVRSRRAAVLFDQIWKGCGIVVKSSALLSIWIFVIPVLIGLLFELLVIGPMRVPVDESPVFLLYQDWALGMLFLKLWTQLVMLGMMPLVDESWRAKFERVREDGFSRLQGLWVLREIILPIILKLLTALCVPYVVARGVFPAFGYPLVVNSAVYRFAWLGCLFLHMVFLCAKRLRLWLTNLHNSIRDDHYLIGLKVQNFGEVSVEKVVEQIKDSSVDRAQCLI